MADRRNQSSQKRAKKKKSSGFGIWLVILLCLLVPRLTEAVNSQSFYRLRVQFTMTVRRLEIQLGLNSLARDLTRSIGFDPLPWIALILILGLLVWAVKAIGKRAKAENTRADHTGRVSTAVRRPDPRSKSFTQPDPYCVVCDHTGEDHFQHDKTQRLRQLDEWLKNGLIDREEYRVMKSRYERDL